MSGKHCTVTLATIKGRGIMGKKKEKNRKPVAERIGQHWNYRTFKDGWGNVATVCIGGKFAGIAVCSKHDKFDKQKGMTLAFERYDAATAQRTVCSADNHCHLHHLSIDPAVIVLPKDRNIRASILAKRYILNTKEFKSSRTTMIIGVQRNLDRS